MSVVAREEARAGFAVDDPVRQVGARARRGRAGAGAGRRAVVASIVVLLWLPGRRRAIEAVD